MLSEGRVRQIHTYTLHFPPAVINISRHRYPSVILIPLFLCLFSLPLDTNWLRGESSIRPETLRTPPHGPSHVNIQFLNEFLKIYTTLESPKDDQDLIIFGRFISILFTSILFTRFQRSSLAERGRWKEIFFPDSKLEKPSAGEKSRCCTCTEACHSPFE